MGQRKTWISVDGTAEITFRVRGGRQQPIHARYLRIARCQRGRRQRKAEAVLKHGGVI